MENYFKTFNLAYAKDISYSIGLIIIGLLITIFANAIIATLATTIGFIIVIHSIIKIYSIKYVSYSTTLPMIFVELAIGLTLICHRTLLTSIYPIIVALFLIYYFASKLDSLNNGYDTYSKFNKIFVIVVISLSIALLLIPTKWSSTIISIVVGVTLIVVGVANIIRHIINNVKLKPKNKNDEEIIIEVD